MVNCDMCGDSVESSATIYFISVADHILNKVYCKSCATIASSLKDPIHGVVDQYLLASGAILSGAILSTPDPLPEPVITSGWMWSFPYPYPDCGESSSPVPEEPKKEETWRDRPPLL
jgi:hypothetical protein